jgi:hypothetical protein
MYRKPPYGGKNLLIRLRLAIGAMGTPCDLPKELMGAEAPFQHARRALPLHRTSKDVLCDPP